MRVWNAKRSTKSKQPETRQVPMIPPMRELLERLQKSNPQPTQGVCGVGECEKSLDRALQFRRRGTHHAPRFAALVRNPSVLNLALIFRPLADGLGTLRRGAAMKTYGHLRNKHSTAMAQKVTFGAQKEAA